MGNDSLNYSNLKFLFSMSMCLYVIHDPTSFLTFLSCQNKDYDKDYECENCGPNLDLYCKKARFLRVANRQELLSLATFEKEKRLRKISSNNTPSPFQMDRFVGSCMRAGIFSF